MSESREPCPTDVLGWIPWYPDQGLDDAQRGAVEAHAAGCPACRAELAMLQGGTQPDVDAPPASELLARIWKRIDAAEAPEGEDPRRSGGAGRPRRAGPRRGRRAAGLLAAAAAALALLALGFAAARWIEPGSRYQLATGGAAPAVSGGPLLDVVFAPNAPASKISDALLALEAEVVAGPTVLGRYRLQLPEGADAGQAARELRSKGARVALYAEPARP